MSDLAILPPSPGNPAGRTSAAAMPPVAALAPLPLETVMLAEAEVLPPETAGTDIVALVERNPSMVLFDTERFDVFYERMKAETDKLDADVSTKRGRDEIRSMAARVVRSRTAIDKARLDLTKQWREQTTAVNAANKIIEARLDALADSVRAPLTEWETAEKARVQACEAIIAGFRSAAIVALGDTAADVRQRGMDVWAVTLDPAAFGDMLDEAQAAKDSAVATLKAALARLEKEETDLAELHKLRAAEAERVAREAAEREAVEAAEREAEEARRAEEARVEAEQAEAARIEAARVAAAQAARDEADRVAREEREAREAKHAAELKEAQDRADRLEAEAQAERDRIAAETEARIAEERRVAAEQAQREANKAHRTCVKTAAKQAIMTCGATEDVAQKIVLAIIAGEVPAVTLAF